MVSIGQVCGLMPFSLAVSSVNSAERGPLARGGDIPVSSHMCDDLLTTNWVKWLVAAPSQQGREGGQGLRLLERIIGTRRGTIDIKSMPSGLRVTLVSHVA